MGVVLCDCDKRISRDQPNDFPTDKKMQNKIFQASNAKQNKEKQSSKKSLSKINTVLNNNIELSKHKSHEIYGQYSPSNLILPFDWRINLDA